MHQDAASVRMPLLPSHRRRTASGSKESVQRLVDRGPNARRWCGLLGGGGSGNLVVGLIAALELTRYSVEGLEVAVDHEEEGGIAHPPLSLSSRRGVSPPGWFRPDS